MSEKQLVIDSPANVAEQYGVASYVVELLPETAEASLIARNRKESEIGRFNIKQTGDQQFAILLTMGKSRLRGDLSIARAKDDSIVVSARLGEQSYSLQSDPKQPDSPQTSGTLTLASQEASAVAIFTAVHPLSLSHSYAITSRTVSREARRAGK